MQPALFISHLDVVPVTPGTEQDWTHPPFSGQVADGFIWGEQLPRCRPINRPGHVRCTSRLQAQLWHSP